MKRFVKRSMAAILVVVMLLSAAPLNGFVGLFDMFDFSIEASAASLSAEKAKIKPTVYSQLGKKGAYGNGKNKGTYHSSGCGVFAIVNAVKYLTGNTIPYQDLGNYAMKNGLCFYNSLMINSAKSSKNNDKYGGFGDKYGYKISSELYFGSDKNKLKYGGITNSGYPSDTDWKNKVYPSLVKNISAGRVAIVQVFGHYMAIVDYDKSSDTFLMLDSAANTGKRLDANGGTYKWVSPKDLNYNANKGYPYIQLRSKIVYYERTNVTVTLDKSKDTVTNTSATINANLNTSFSLQGAYYILSTNKADVNVDATKENNRKKTSTRDFVTVKGAHTAKSVKADVLTYQGAKLQPNKTYYYKILVKVSGKWYQSSVSFFTTANNLPATPELTFVTGKTDYALSDSIAVMWKSVANAESYTVTLYDANLDVIDIESGIKSNSYDLAKSTEWTPEPGDYYLGITAVNSVGKKDASAKKKFTVHEDKTVEFYDTVNNQIIKVETVPYGHSANAPKMSSITGYTFLKWDADISKITNNIRINAVYEPHEYTVTFVDANDEIISKKVVKYGQSAELPEEPKKDGYVFSAWSVKSGEGNSYIAVNGNVTFEPTFVWENASLPLYVTVSKALRTSDSKGYTVTSKVTNGTAQPINAKLIAVVKTSNDKVVATKMDVVTIPANADKYEIVTNIGGTAVGTIAEVYIVANDKEDDNKTGGAYSEKAYAKVTRDVTTTNQYWSDWSSWSDVKPDTNDDREIESKKQYRYSDKEFSTANSTTKSGWELVSSTPASYTSWGSWSSWSTTKQTETKTKDVETRTVYKYQHYCNGKGGIAPTTKYDNAVYGPHTVYSTKKWTVDRESSTGYDICDGHTKCAKGCGSYYYMGTVTQYRYRTRKPVYNFYRWMDWSAWSDTVYTESANRKIDSKEVYRYRDLCTSSETVSENYIGEENLTGTTYTFKGNLDNIQANYSGMVATVMVYKEKNNDPTESQIEYVGQITLGESNSYNFKFIPREEISIITGDYIVSFGIATADGLVNYVDVVEAPKPQYTVTYYDFDGETVLEKVTVSEGGTVLPSEETLEMLNVPEGHRFTNWNQSTVNVRSDLAVMPLSEVQTFAVVFIDWESQNVVIEELEYGAKITPPEATQKEGYNVSWDMSMAQKLEDVQTVAEDDEEQIGVEDDMYIAVRHTVVSTLYEEIEYNSTFLSPESDIAKEENGLLDEVEVNDEEGDGSAIVTEEDIILESNNTFDEHIETPMEVEEAEEYIFRGWKNITTGEYLTDMRPQNDAIYVPMYEFAETVEDPVADIVTGEYTEAQTVTLTSATESAVIYYTLDGTDPKTSDSAVIYTGPITISKSCVLMYCAMAVNMNSSETLMELYAINTSDAVPYYIVSVYSDLPHTDGMVYQSLVKDFVRFDATPLQDFEGYTFSGLYYDEDLTEVFDTQNEPVIESMDVYAHYVPLQYNVTFLDEDGTVLSTQSVEYGTAVEEPEAPTKEGYVFIGWDSDGYECVTEDGTYTARYIPESEYAYVSIKGRAVIPAYVDKEVKLSIEITPDELSEEPVSWTSSDPSIATVDYMGNVTLVGVGTVYITVTVDSNGESDTVEFRVNEDNTVKVVLGPQSYMMYDTSGYLRGLKVAVNTVEEVRSHFTNDELHFFNSEGTELGDTDKVGTDTVVRLMDGDDILDEKTFIMTGDVNGDGWYDGQDSTIVACLAEGMLTSDDVSEAVYIAADCNYDGVIDQKDVELLNKAGALISNVDQNQPVEDLEEDENFVAYASLIDQTADIEIEIDDTDESPAEPDEEINTDPENGENTDEDTTQPEDDMNNSIEWLFLSILEFFKSVFSFLMSLIFG